VSAASEAGALLRAEIAEQPEVWRAVMRDQRATLEAAADAIRAAHPELLVLIARGTSDHAAMFAQYYAQVRLGVPAMLATPSAVTAYDADVAYPRSVAIAISQSGASPDLLATVASVKADGVPVIAVTNTLDSPLASAGDLLVPLHAGPELSVAATKTYTATLLALLVMIGLAAGDSWEDWEARVAELADDAQGLLAPETLPAGLVDAFLETSHVMVVGRGYSMASAREGALKLTETNSVPASGWSSADATHGPLGQVRPGALVFVLTAGEVTRPAVESFAAAAAGLGGTIVAVGRTVEGASFTIPLPERADAELPLIEAIPFQLLALEGALRRGVDPDRPAGLAKVTRTS